MKIPKKGREAFGEAVAMIIILLALSYGLRWLFGLIQGGGI